MEVGPEPKIQEVQTVKATPGGPSIAELNAIQDQIKQQGQEGLQPVKKPKKPLTAYFIFRMEFMRENKGIRMKEISERWNSMDKDQLSKYTSQAKQLHQEYTEKMAEYRNYLDSLPEEDTDNDQGELGEDGEELGYKPGNTDFLIPLARMKSILKVDSQNSQGIRKALILSFQQVVNNFASDLVGKSIATMKRQGKKKLTSKHLLQGIKYDRKLDFLLESGIFGDDMIKSTLAEKKKSPKKARRSQPSDDTGQTKKRQVKIDNFKSDMTEDSKMEIEGQNSKGVAQHQTNRDSKHESNRDQSKVKNNPPKTLKMTNFFSKKTSNQSQNFD